MAKRREQSKALFLRRKGLSYTQIRKIVGVSKSTLSLWLRDHPLPEDRIRELRDFNQQRIENFRATMRKKRQLRLGEVYESLHKRILPLTKKEFYVAGLMLYWGEGGKTTRSDVVFTNTNPQVIRFAIKWLLECFGVDPKRFHVHLHLYKDMNIGKEISYWTKELSLSRSQFRKPYVKNNKQAELTYKGRFGHGTCNLYLGDVKIKEEILMGIKILSEFPNI